MFTKHPVHPGEVLREDFLKPLGMSVNALAKALRVPATRIDAARRKSGFGRSPSLFTLASNWLPRRSVPPGQRSSAVPDHPDHRKLGRQRTLRSPDRA
jgi:hypothetical protein